MGALDDQAPQDPPDRMLGRTVAGRYRIEEVLGEGGIAVVYRAEHLGVGRHVALKMLHETYGEHAELRARFEREAKALAALSHPHIVSMIDYGVEDNAPYLVMELLEGQTLRELLDQEGTLPLERGIPILRQVLRALAFAHGLGLIHRDLKPGNVFLQALPDTADHVKILDFGFAKFLAGERGEQGPALTRAGKVFGTPAYMAPEQITGDAIDGRVDLYAAGVLLFEMVTGQKPFEGEVSDMIRAKVVAAAPSLGATRPDLRIAQPLEAFVARSLGRREQRWEDAQQMLAGLDALPAEPVQPPVPAAAAPAPASTSASGKGSRALLIAALAAVPVLLLLAVCAGGLGYLAMREDDRTVPLPLPVNEPDTTEPPTVVVEMLPVPDPWQEGDVPALLQDVLERVAVGEDVDQDTIVALRRHARANPDDGRAWLLMGHLFVQRGWRSDAITQYQLAHRVDSTLRGDPRMLANLVALSAHGGVSEDAARAVEAIYGGEALPTIEAALDNPNLRPDGATRLARLRARLSGT